MPKVDGSLGSLIQGVSQQPARARLPGQSELQVNVSNDEVFGMSRRNSTSVTARMAEFADDSNGTRITESGNVHLAGEALPYLARMGPSPFGMRVLHNGSVSDVVVDALSAPYLLTDTDALTYERNLIFTEMSDTVYVLNTQKPVAMLADLPAYSTLNATVVYVRGVEYAVGYTLRFEIDGEALDHHITYAVPNGAVAADTEKGQVRSVVAQLYGLSTETYIGSAGTTATSPLKVLASDLTFNPSEGKYYASLGADTALAAHFDISMVGEYIVFAPKVSTLDYTITATETSGAELLVAVYDRVEDVGRLPNRAPVDMVVRVTGSNRAEDDYFMQWLVDDKATNTINDIKGVWSECTAPGEPFKLDPATMPQELYLDGTDFHIRPVTWVARAAGADLSNPAPNFVGGVIQDMTDFQERAVFLHDTSVSMSENEDATSWFNKTSATNLDTDPIHVRSTANKGVSNMIYVVPFNRDLVLIGSNNTQHIINGRTEAKPDTAALTLSAGFEIDLASRPVTIGENIMFTSFSGKFTQVHEMYLTAEDVHARRTITDHVPRYIEGRATTLAASDGSNTTVVISDNLRELSVYEYLWLDQRRVQSAWSKWTFGMDVIAAAIKEGVLQLTLQDASGGYVISHMDLFKQDAPELTHTIHLDYTTSATLAGAVTVDVPYSGLAADLLRILSIQIGTGAEVSGNRMTVTSVTDVSTSTESVARITYPVAVTGDVLIGTRFTTSLTPTMPVMRDGDGVAITGAQLSVADFTITTVDTGPFVMTRQSSYEDAADYWTLTYSGRRLGSPALVLGTAPVDTGPVQFPFEDQTTLSKLHVECDTHLPMTITEIEWAGHLKNRSKRITNGG